MNKPADIIAAEARAASEQDPVGETLSGRSYASAWAGIVAVLDEVAPSWCNNRERAPAENAISAIRQLALPILRATVMAPDPHSGVLEVVNIFEQCTHRSDLFLRLIKRQLATPEHAGSKILLRLELIGPPLGKILSERWWTIPASYRG